MPNILFVIISVAIIAHMHLVVHTFENVALFVFCFQNTIHNRGTSFLASSHKTFYVHAFGAGHCCCILSEIFVHEYRRQGQAFDAPYCDFLTQQCWRIFFHKLCTRVPVGQVGFRSLPSPKNLKEIK